MSSIPSKPQLIGAHSYAHRVLDERVLRGIGLMRAGAGITISWDGEQYIITSTAKNNSSQPFSVVLYGDPTAQGYAAGVFYKILDTDFAVTDGYVCSSGATVKAVAGKWLCLKSVPTLKNDTTDPAKYIPTIPAASGSYDPANADNYWEFFTPSQICDGVI
jgi:hypothetical protein